MPPSAASPAALWHNGSQPSQIAILHPGIDLPPRIAKLLKQLLRLLNTLQPVLEIGDRRGQLGRCQQGVSPRERNGPLDGF